LARLETFLVEDFYGHLRLRELIVGRNDRGEGTLPDDTIRHEEFDHDLIVWVLGIEQQAPKLGSIQHLLNSRF
jgi:hypothetical protein